VTDGTGHRPLGSHTPDLDSSCFHGTRQKLAVEIYYLDQLQSTPRLIPCLSKTHFNIIPSLHSGFWSRLFSWGYPSKMVHAFPISSMRATCSVRIILVDVITTYLGRFSLLTCVWVLLLSRCSSSLQMLQKSFRMHVTLSKSEALMNVLVICFCGRYLLTLVTWDGSEPWG
jgi:hypothetical protein